MNTSFRQGYHERETWWTCVKFLCLLASLRTSFEFGIFVSLNVYEFCFNERITKDNKLEEPRNL